MRYRCGRVGRRRGVDRDPPERRVPLRARAVADRVERQLTELDLLVDPRLLDAHRRQRDLQADVPRVGRVEREDRAGVDAVLGRRVDELVVVAPRLHRRGLERARGVVQRVGGVVEVAGHLPGQLHGAVRARLDLHRRRPPARVVGLEVDDEARRRALGERVAVHARARGRRDLGLDRARRGRDGAVLARDVAQADGVEARTGDLVVVRERVRVRARAGPCRVRPGGRDHEDVTAAAGAPHPVEVGVREARDLRLRIVVPGVVAARRRARVHLCEAVGRLRGRHVVAVVPLRADEHVDERREVALGDVRRRGRDGRGRWQDADGERRGEGTREGAHEPVATASSGVGYGRRAGPASSDSAVKTRGRWSGHESSPWGVVPRLLRLAAPTVRGGPGRLKTP
ncbi:MAG: hypothetical protein K0S43_3915, partial [Cellulosimicrobium sp.]|nr:hypothetical protein [Cellulosimicrobium sp.]